jgi:hypothetical protein
MAQVTWRSSEGLIARVRLQAAHYGLSMNEYVTRVLETATNPDYSADPASQVRERLRLAGLLADVPEFEGSPPDPDAVAAARKRAGEGTSLSDLVIEGR